MTSTVGGVVRAVCVAMVSGTVGHAYLISAGHFGVWIFDAG
jgi:hypothetical protein